MSKTIEMIKQYVPYNEQEEKDKQFFIDCEKIEQILTCQNERCHLTSSYIILNKKHNKVLGTYYTAKKDWPLGGEHANGVDDMPRVAKKEIFNNYMFRNCRMLLDHPISIESFPVSGGICKGQYVPAHIHLNVTYLFETSEEDEEQINDFTNLGDDWFDADELMEKSKEAYMKPIYKKIFEKIKILINEKQI